MAPFDDRDDPLAAQFARFRQDTLDAVRPPGAAEARRLYADRRRTRVLVGAIVALVVALVAAGGGYAIHQGNSRTVPAGRSSDLISPTPTVSPSTGTSAPEESTPASTDTVAGNDTTVPAGVRVTSVTAIGVNSLWALGYAPCTGHTWADCPAVLRSRDGGHTWENTHAPDTAGVPGEIRFANPDDGWIVTRGLLFATHDGGDSWHPVNVPKAAQVEAAGGQVWVTDVAGDALFSAPVASDSFTKVAGATGTNLTVHGHYAYTYGTTTLSTVHAGAVGQHALPCPATDVHDVALATVDDTHLTVVCGGPPDATGQDKVAFQSGDAGATWTSLGTPAHAGVITSLAASRAGTFLAGTGTSVQATRDAGTTWATVLPLDAEGGFQYVGFTDDNHGFALGGADGTPRIRLTTDAGRTWTSYAFGPS